MRNHWFGAAGWWSGWGNQSLFHHCESNEDDAKEIVNQITPQCFNFLLLSHPVPLMKETVTFFNLMTKTILSTGLFACLSRKWTGFNSRCCCNQTPSTARQFTEIHTCIIWRAHFKNLIPTRYSFIAQVTAKKPIFSSKFTTNGNSQHFWIWEYKISTNSNTTIGELLSGPVIKHNYKKHNEKQRNKVTYFHF